MRLGITFVVLSTFLSLTCLAQEICDNQVDDDGDGLIDLNDIDDCSCEGTFIGDTDNLISNGSFENMGCCPQAEHQIYCTPGWLVASNATSDYFHLCGYFNPAIPLPLPDGDGVMGGILEPGSATNFSYSEYITTCPTSTLLAGENYSLNLYIAGCTSSGESPDVASIDLTLYGYPTCGSGNPLISTMECPAPYGWYELGSVEYQPNCSWNVVSIDFTPNQNTNAIMIGPPCEFDASYLDIRTWFFYDDLTLGQPSEVEITQTGGTCIEDLVLSSEQIAGVDYQWYYEGAALPGETSPSLNLGYQFEFGWYQLRAFNSVNGTCKISQIEINPSQSNDIINFESNTQVGCVPLHVSFTNLTPSEFDGQFQWEINSGVYETTDLDITLSNPGLYSVTLTGTTEDGCVTSATIEDYIEVYSIPSPEISSIQHSECAPFNILLEEVALEGNFQYVWEYMSEEISTEAFVLLELQSEGTHTIHLEVIDQSTGCSASDAAELSLINDLPTLILEGPESLCRSGSSDTLRANFYEGTVFWSQGETTPFLEIFEPGTYSVILTREDGCSTLDSITVEPLEKPSIITSNKEGCLGEQVQLFAQSNVQDVRWVNISNTQVAYVSQEGVYLAQAENECGISTTEAVVTFKDCSCPVYIPNAFSPNGDGVNDIFKPELNCPLQFYELRILNRWGNEVYFSNDPQKGWNGSSENGGQYFGPSQVYNYILKYDNGKKAIGQRNEIHGSFLLLR